MILQYKVREIKVADNLMNFEEYKLYLLKQYPKEKMHIALIWLSALKVHAKIKTHLEEKKQSEWNRLLDELKNKKVK